MTFEPRALEARVASNIISSTDMPALAWDAIEAGLDGPAIRRMAALEFPTFFDIYKEFSLKQSKCVFPGVRATRAVCH